MNWTFAWETFPRNIKLLIVFRTYVWNQWYYYLPQAVGAYLLYDWAKKKNYEVSRKNPADYANDQ
ncbi:unnamed protein product [Cylicostephanus goldi]|uniref:Cytochrome b-c1 complex subunit 8 n=1 Tax=Cylicostephanus goldi TaxID=71465 RepID=A0A3P7N341_CYLGO|nr:unnamed protein product [Cylicostephanus goldi]